VYHYTPPGIKARSVRAVVRTLHYRLDVNNLPCETGSFVVVDGSLPSNVGAGMLLGPG
jgi:sulfate adenylyltransferase subunit 1 (EFTu-like GTPase family)